MSPSLLVFVYRDLTEDVWETARIPETRLQAFLEGGWHILIMEDDIRRQLVEDQFRQDTQPFNGIRLP